MKHIKYPYLPEGRQIKYVSKDNPFMAEARRCRDTLSTDGRVPTGAVIVKDGKVIGRAGNQTVFHKKTFLHQWLLQTHKKVCIRRLFGVPTGKMYWLCPGCASPKTHAERGAINDAKVKGEDPAGADLYLYGHWWACKPCWDSMMSAGIRDVYLLEGSEVVFNNSHSDKSIGVKAKAV